MGGSTTAWFGLWAYALFMTALGYVWMAQGKHLLATLAAVSTLGCMVSILAKALQARQ